MFRIYFFLTAFGLGLIYFSKQYNEMIIAGTMGVFGMLLVYEVSLWAAMQPLTSHFQRNQQYFLTRCLMLIWLLFGLTGAIITPYVGLSFLIWLN